MLEKPLAILDQDFLKDHLFQLWIVTIDEQVCTKYQIILSNSKCMVVATMERVQQLFHFIDKCHSELLVIIEVYFVSN